MESIRILQDTYEKLYVITPLITDLLENNLTKLDNWKEKCDEVLNRHTNGKMKQWFYFVQLDLYYLLILLGDNWNELKNKTKNDFFNDNNKELFVSSKDASIKSIRNAVCHPEQCDYSLHEYNMWKDSLSQAAKAFGEDIDELVKQYHEKEKTKILEYLFTNTTYETLKCPDLPADVRRSIENTRDRLWALPTASAVITFLRDAKNATRGQYIKASLEKLGCKTFDEFLPKVEELYYGFTL